MRKLLSGLTAIVVTAAVLSVASPADAATRYTVTAVAGTAKVDVGQSFTLSGTVTPKATGQRVLVQRRTGSSWTTIKRTTLNRRSRYVATVKVTTAGTNLYRVLKPRSNGHRKGISPTVTVVGWRWRSITTLPTYGTITNANLLSSGQLGQPPYLTTYQPFLELGSPAGDDGSISYLLANNCTRFEGVVGVSADSNSDNTQTAIVGVIPTGGALMQIAGQPVQRNRDPAYLARSGSVIAQAMVLNLYGDVNVAGTYIAWGNPRVYCRS